MAELQYFKRRRSSSNLSDIEMDGYFKVLVDSYSEAWLNADDGHPIQELWQRSDELSTAELYSLASGIKTMLEIDKAWTLDQIDKSKSKQKNTRQGAIFEITGLSIFKNEDTIVKPAKRDQAGYDGIVSFKDGSSMRTSIKSYGMSAHEIRFEQFSSEIEDCIKILLQEFNVPPVHIMIDSPVKYPEKADWEKLKAKLRTIFEQKAGFTYLASRKDETKEFYPENANLEWTVIVHPFSENVDQYHPAFKTYTLIISGRHHKNEHENLFSKIDDACNNLTKHAADEKEGLANAILIHLPPTASLTKCNEWLVDYFDLYPNKSVSIIIFYQPTVATDINTNNNFLNHCFNIITPGDRILKYLPGGLHLNCMLPIGLFSSEPVTLQLIAEYPDGRKESRTVDDRYFYQSGNHYMKMQPDGKGGFFGNIEQLGNGVFSHIIIEFPGQPEKAAIGGKFPPKDVLLIL